MKGAIQLGKILVYPAILLFFSGCGGCGALQELHFTNTKPKESDLTGIYKPNGKTLARITKNGGYASAKCQIKIDAAGGIEFIDMPDWWEGGSGNKKVVSTNGTWRLEKHDSHWQIVWEHANTIDFNLHLMGEKSPYKIDVYVVDPDSDLFLIFEQSK